MSGKHIFVVDDEKNIRDILEKYIRNAGYTVSLFPDGSRVLPEIRRLKPDLIVLDIMLPGDDGLTLCREIRKESEIPIIFVSARDEEFDKVLGLEIGADDYLTKPFSPRELLARIKVIFKRLDKASTGVSDRVVLRDLILDRTARTIHSADGNELKLTLKEYDLFEYLARHPNRPFTREQLVLSIWGYDYEGDDRIVDDLVKRIRKKLKEIDSAAEISTVWGYGYKIENEDADSL